MTRLPHAESFRDLDEIGRMLFSMITKSHLFCGEISDKIREPLSEYFIEAVKSLDG